MRVVVVTDIHGNLGAFLAVLADLRTQAPDLVVFGGDAALFGAHGLECWQRVLELGWPLVQGNTDRYLVNPHPVLRALRETSPPAAEHLERNLRWTRAQLGDRLSNGWPRCAPSFGCRPQLGRWSWFTPRPGTTRLGSPPTLRTSSCVPESLPWTRRCWSASHPPCLRAPRGHILVVNCGSVGRTYDGQPGRAPTRCWTTRRAAGRPPYVAFRTTSVRAHRDTRARGVPLSGPFLASLLTARDPAA